MFEVSAGMLATTKEREMKNVTFNEIQRVGFTCGKEWVTLTEAVRAMLPPRITKGEYEFTLPEKGKVVQNEGTAWVEVVYDGPRLHSAWPPVQYILLD